MVEEKGLITNIRSLEPFLFKILLSSQGTGRKQSQRPLFMGPKDLFSFAFQGEFLFSQRQTAFPDALLDYAY